MAASSNNSVGALSNSPRKSSGSTAPAAWTQIVAGAGDAEPIEDNKAHGSINEAGAEVSLSVGGEGDASKRPVWSRPANGGAVEVVVEPVMGADSWPALSQIGKAGPPKSSPESSKSLLPEPSLPLSPGPGTAPFSQKQGNSSQHPNSSQNHGHPTRQKSFKRHGGSSSGNNGNVTQPPLSPTSAQSVPVPSNQNSSSYQKNSNLESGPKLGFESQSHGNNSDRPQHNNPHRRGNGPHQQHGGDSSHNQRYGARRDQDRPNRDWNSQRSFNGREIQPPPPGVVPRGIIRHAPMPHGSTPFLTPPLSPTMRPFGPPVSYPEYPVYYLPVQPDSIRGMGIPFVAPMPPQMFYHHPDVELYTKVIQQIDYYFSNENLIKDTFLRRNMDEQGWVPIRLIAGFKKVMNLTDNISFILDAIRSSTVVEVQDDKLRRRNDWMKWLIPDSLNVPSQSTYQDTGSSSNDITARVQSVTLDDENPSK